MFLRLTSSLKKEMIIIAEIDTIIVISLTNLYFDMKTSINTVDKNNKPKAVLSPVT